MYSAVLLTMYVWAMVSFPGYVNNKTLVESDAWFEGTEHRLNLATLVFWTALNIISFVVTSYAIWKIRMSIKLLQVEDRKLKLNMGAMLIHLCMLLLLMLVSFV